MHSLTVGSLEALFLKSEVPQVVCPEKDRASPLIELRGQDTYKGASLIRNSAPLQ